MIFCYILITFIGEEIHKHILLVGQEKIKEVHLSFPTTFFRLFYYDRRRWVNSTLSKIPENRTYCVNFLKIISENLKKNDIL